MSAQSLASVPQLVPLGAHQGTPGFAINRPAVVVGSRADARILLKSSTVSNHHALLVVTREGMYVRDLASRTGTMVNGRAVVEAELVGGDQLQVGRFTFRYVAPEKSPPATPRAEQALLQVESEDTPLPIDGRVVVIGRRATCDVPLLEDAASLTHAIIFEKDGERFIRDLASRTGTFVNGRKIHQEPLRTGDVIRCGTTELTYLARAGTSIADAPQIDAPQTEALRTETSRVETPRATTPRADDVSRAEVLPIDPIRTEAPLPESSDTTAPRGEASRVEAPLPLDFDDLDLLPLAGSQRPSTDQNDRKTPARPTADDALDFDLLDLEPLDRDDETTLPPAAVAEVPDSPVISRATPAPAPDALELAPDNGLEFDDDLLLTTEPPAAITPDAKADDTAFDVLPLEDDAVPPPAVSRLVPAHEILSDEAPPKNAPPAESPEDDEDALSALRRGWHGGAVPVDPEAFPESRPDSLRFPPASETVPHPAVHELDPADHATKRETFVPASELPDIHPTPIVEPHLEAPAVPAEDVSIDSAPAVPLSDTLSAEPTRRMETNAGDDLLVTDEPTPVRPPVAPSDRTSDRSAEPTARATPIDTEPSTTDTEAFAPFDLEDVDVIDPLQRSGTPLVVDAEIIDTPSAPVGKAADQADPVAPIEIDLSTARFDDTCEEFADENAESDETPADAIFTGTATFTPSVTPSETPSNASAGAEVAPAIPDPDAPVSKSSDTASIESPIEATLQPDPDAPTFDARSFDALPAVPGIDTVISEAPAVTPEAVLVARRGRGRPRKTPIDAPAAPPAEPKKRGRKPKNPAPVAEALPTTDAPALSPTDMATGPVATPVSETLDPSGIVLSPPDQHESAGETLLDESTGTLGVDSEVLESTDPTPESVFPIDLASPTDDSPSDPMSDTQFARSVSDFAGSGVGDLVEADLGVEHAAIDKGNRVTLDMSALDAPEFDAPPAPSLEGLAPDAPSAPHAEPIDFDRPDLDSPDLAQPVAKSNDIEIADADDEPELGDETLRPIHPPVDHPSAPRTAGDSGAGDRPTGFDPARFSPIDLDIDLDLDPDAPVNDAPVDETPKAASPEAPASVAKPMSEPIVGGAFGGLNFGPIIGLGGINSLGPIDEPIRPDLQQPDEQWPAAQRPDTPQPAARADDDDSEFLDTPAPSDDAGDRPIQPPVTSPPSRPVVSTAARAPGAVPPRPRRQARVGFNGAAPAPVASPFAGGSTGQSRTIADSLIASNRAGQSIDAFSNPSPVAEIPPTRGTAAFPQPTAPATLVPTVAPARSFAPGEQARDPRQTPEGAAADAAVDDALGLNGPASLLEEARVAEEFDQSTSAFGATRPGADRSNPAAPFGAAVSDESVGTLAEPDVHLATDSPHTQRTAAAFRPRGQIRPLVPDGPSVGVLPAGPGPVQAAQRRRKNVRRALILLPVALVLAGAIGYAIWFFRPVAPAQVKTTLRFKQLDKLAVPERNRFRDRQDDLLADPQTYASAADLLRQTDAQRQETTDPGFLADPLQRGDMGLINYDPAARWPDSSPTEMRLALKSAEPARDRDRLAALAHAVQQKNRALTDAARVIEADAQRNQAKVTQTANQLKDKQAELLAVKERGNTAHGDQTLPELERAALAADTSARAARAEVRELEEQYKLLSEPAGPAAPVDPATVLAGDPSYQDLLKQLASVNAKVELARTVSSEQSDAARKGLDEAIAKFETQLNGAQKTLGGDSPEMIAYVAAAKAMFETTKQLTDDLIRRSDIQRKRMIERKNNLEAYFARQREKKFNEDATLKELRERLAIHTRQFNAAKASGMDTAPLNLDGNLIRDLIAAREKELGADAAPPEIIAEWQRGIEEDEADAREQRTETDQMLADAQQKFLDAAPAAEKLPAEQKAATADLNKQLVAVNDARKQYNKLIDDAVAKSAADAAAMRQQQEEVQAQVDLRRGELVALAEKAAEDAVGAGRERQRADVAKRLEIARAALAQADEQAELATAARRRAEDEKAAFAANDANRANLEREIASLQKQYDIEKGSLETLQARSLTAVAPDLSEPVVEVDQPAGDTGEKRLIYSFAGGGATLLLGLLGVGWFLLQAGREHPQPVANDFVPPSDAHDHLHDDLARDIPTATALPAREPAGV